MKTTFSHPTYSALRRLTAVIMLALLPFVQSCNSVKQFLASDLEDEDYIMGQLREDEYVAEKPYIPPTKETKPSEQGSGTVAVALENLRTPDDDARLFDAIAPWMGTPYRYGGTSHDGVDCSGFVGQVMLTAYGVKLHRVANDMQQDVTEVGREALRQGDIVFFTNSKGRVSHVGIYLKDNVFVHSSTSNGVCLSRLDTGYWPKHFYKGGRVSH